MTRYEFGDVVLVRVPFTDQQGAKQRPAVVISRSAYSRARPDVIVMAVTGRILLGRLSVGDQAAIRQGLRNLVG
ncbi:MAG: type II toxin-antitoxin system PemK/MazF family toxin [Acidobacteria bacterium]|nr:type II toxin-antitoxin system PemK/MazF family toxin [Acidobacteriota bacterium]